MLDWNELRRILGRHDFKKRHYAASPWEGLVLGNGQMGAVVFGSATSYTWRINRNDLWDGRWPQDEAVRVYPLSELKRLGFELSKRLGVDEPIKEFNLLPWEYAGVPYPCRRIGADFVLRLTPLTRTPPGEQRVRLADATLRSKFTVGLWNTTTLKVDSRVLADREVLALRVTGIGDISRDYLMFALRRDPWGGRTWDNLAQGEWGVRGWKDPRAGTLPPAEVRAEGNLAILNQLFPGDEDADPYTLSVVALVGERLPFRMEESGAAVLDASQHRNLRRLTFFIATATAEDAGQAESEARRSAEDAARLGWSALGRIHSDRWKDFWIESAVELGERSVERNWYRASFILRANVRQGGATPGLYGIDLPFDCPPWRSDRHNNFPELSSTFWGSYPANHLSLALNYTEFVERFMPTARRIAREIYECDGTAFPHLTVDRTRRYYFDNLWSRSLYITAAYAQNLWWHFEYSGDVEYLRRRAYPIMVGCADFYVSLMSKNDPGDYTLWPTVPAEYRGFVKDFRLNKNMIEDLAMVKFLLRSVVKASEILGTDGTRWRDLLDRLPDYETMEVDGQVVFADVSGNTALPPYNHSLGLAPIFPAEDPDVYGKGRWREVAIRTLDFRAWSDNVRRGVAYARLGRSDEVLRIVAERDSVGVNVAVGGTVGGDSACGFVMKASILRVICEMLLSSFDGTIRLFPAWPKGRRARFFDLRAVGGFRVSASCDGAAIGPVSIASDGGNPVTLLLPWPKCEVVESPTGTRVARERLTATDGRLAFPTEAGRLYQVLPAE